MSNSPTFEDISISIAHWPIKSWGGAEYLVTKLAEALNVSRVYTLGDPTPDDPNPYGDITFEDALVSFSQVPIRRLETRFGRVFEYALWEDVDWREFGHPDVLVTSGATTRAAITPDDTLHINYCHSPPRWFYDLYHDRKPSLMGVIARPLVRHLRTRDAAIDPRVDHYLANSPIIERRIWKYYKRDAEVVYPPIDLDKYRNDGDDGFFLHLGRLDAEKGVESVVTAFAGTDHELVLAGGKGDVADRVLPRINSAPNIDYRGFVSETEKIDLLATCRALVFNGRNEDFGIVPVEANASGKACIVRNEGFPGLFVDDGVNGYLHDGTSDGIIDAIERFARDGIAADPRQHVAKFGIEKFGDRCQSWIEDWYGEFRSKT